MEQNFSSMCHAGCPYHGEEVSAGSPEHGHVAAYQKTVKVVPCTLYRYTSLFKSALLVIVLRCLCQMRGMRIGRLRTCREKKEHRGEMQRESQLWSQAYDVERRGPALPSGHILSCLVTALHSVNSRPAGDKLRHPAVLV